MDHEKDDYSSKIDLLLESLYREVDERIAQQALRVEESKKKNELESKLAQELKLNEELGARRAAAARRGADVARLCAQLEARLHVAAGDQARLAAARDMYQIAKELTGIRWDFNAPPDVAKGFVKNEARKVLEAFSVPAPPAPPAGSAPPAPPAGSAPPDACLWPRLAPAPPAPLAPRGKENQPL